MAARRWGWNACCASILQQWFNLSDPAVEEALYDSLAMRRFVGIDLGREPVPDETTMCRFRHLLEGSPKHPSPAGDLRAGQFVHGAPVSLALQCSVICPTSRLAVAQTQIANQSRHLLQHCHWLMQSQWLASVRQPLVQTFPSGYSTSWRAKPSSSSWCSKR
jgi:Transposase domain (DUF772)